MIQKAKEYAEKAHHGQMRKDGKTPMFAHPMTVAEILKEHNFPEEVVAAGYLHDTVEDTFVTIESIRTLFGEKVAELVASNTEDKSKCWEERKLHTINSIASAPKNVKALIIADKLDNLRSLISSYEKIGEDVFLSFKRGREKQGWYFRSIAENMKHGLPPEEIPEFFHTYEQLVHSFFPS